MVEEVTRKEKGSEDSVEIASDAISKSLSELPNSVLAELRGRIYTAGQEIEDGRYLEKLTDIHNLFSNLMRAKSEYQNKNS